MKKASFTCILTKYCKGLIPTSGCFSISMKINVSFHQLSVSNVRNYDSSLGSPSCLIFLRETPAE